MIALKMDLRKKNQIGSKHKIKKNNIVKKDYILLNLEHILN